MAQRLVRVLDPEACEQYRASEYECRALNVDPTDPPLLRRPRPGLETQAFRGRTGIYELIVVDDAMRTMIHDGASEQELERYARTQGPSIRDDGRRRVLAGTTTMDEVVRVTRDD